MTLPKIILDFLNNNANRNSNSQLNKKDDLFNAGALDSFSIIELASKLEQAYDIKIPDTDIDPVNFQTIEAIESYIITRKG
jgi:acyl carrier protein